LRVIESGIGELIQPPDLDGFREWNREKSRALVDKVMTDAEAISRFVYDGCYIGTELYGTVRCPMSLVREVVRQGKKDLRVAGQGVTELDLWLGAGLVKTLDITYIGLEVFGVSNALRRAVESGQVEKVVEWPNGGITWRFKAAAMGVPFIPIRAMLGTDTLKYSAAKVVECPFTGMKVCLIPALILDVGLIHVHRADKYGNGQVEASLALPLRCRGPASGSSSAPKRSWTMSRSAATPTAPSSPTTWLTQSSTLPSAPIPARWSTATAGTRGNCGSGPRAQRRRRERKSTWKSTSTAWRTTRNTWNWWAGSDWRFCEPRRRDGDE
jgi:acyl CoA:acetate/3-ketoacid CoA transferase alpha subunit